MKHILNLCKVWLILCIVTSAHASPYQLGDTIIRLSISGYGGHYVYVHLHENEGTSLQAAKNILKQRPGELITISSRGNRMIRFSFDKQHYGFDPNRIFTRFGLRQTLAAHSARVSPEAIAIVEKFAHTITRALSGHTIVALHNNTNDSITSYLTGGKFSLNVSQIAYKRGSNPHNFFLMTEKNMFETLKKKGFNVVLQNNAHVTDDGSLSVYAAQHGIPYINVEAAHGALAAQTLMLAALPATSR